MRTLLTEFYANKSLPLEQQVKPTLAEILAEFEEKYVDRPIFTHSKQFREHYVYIKKHLKLIAETKK